MEKQTKENLISAWVAGAASAEEVSALLQLCQDDEQIVEEIVEHTRTTRMMEFLAIEDSLANNKGENFADSVCQNIRKAQGETARFTGDVLGKIDHAKRVEVLLEGSRNDKKILPMVARRKVVLAAVAGVLLFAGLWLLLPSNSVSPVQSGSKPLARIHQLEAVTWGDSPSFTVGEFLDKRKRIQFKSGIVNLKLANGVDLILEGPVDFEITGENSTRIYTGKVVANVPEGAIGFTMDSPDGQIVDLGASFGVDLTGDLGTEVHVLEGQIKIKGNRAEKFQVINENDATMMVASATLGQGGVSSGKPFQAKGASFFTSLPQRDTDKINYLLWKFDEDAGLVAKNSGHGLGGNDSHAFFRSYLAGAAPQRKTGVRGNALYFDGLGAALETHIQGIGGGHARTVAFWIRLPDDFQESSAYAPVSWGSEKVGGLWHISVNPDPEDGPVGSLRASPWRGQIVGSSNLLDGKWHHCAAVMYGGEKASTSTHVLLYVDGELESTVTKSVQVIDTQVTGPQAEPIRIGCSAFFKPSVQKRYDEAKFSFFQGWLDEVFICDAALSQDQVQELMEKGLCSGLKEPGNRE